MFALHLVSLLFVCRTHKKKTFRLSFKFGFENWQKKKKVLEITIITIVNFCYFCFVSKKKFKICFILSYLFAIESNLLYLPMKCHIILIELQLRKTYICLILRLFSRNHKATKSTIINCYFSVLPNFHSLSHTPIQKKTKKKPKTKQKPKQKQKHKENNTEHIEKPLKH